jgi:hypothetical protein
MSLNVVGGSANRTILPSAALKSAQKQLPHGLRRRELR